MNGDILWTQQRSSGVHYERKKWSRCALLVIICSGVNSQWLIVINYLRINCSVNAINMQCYLEVEVILCNGSCA